MKEIQLTQGKVALIDDEDFELVSQFKWHADRKTGGRWYAKRQVGRENIFMHRFILGLPVGHVPQTDHRDNDGLNNQRYNLRVSTSSQNGANSFPRGARPFKGVCLRVRPGRKPCYQAGITVNSQFIYLGSYQTAEEAAQVYDFAALEHFGEFARINFENRSKYLL